MKMNVQHRTSNVQHRMKKQTSNTEYLTPISVSSFLPRNNQCSPSCYINSSANLPTPCGTTILTRLALFSGLNLLWPPVIPVRLVLDLIGERE